MNARAKAALFVGAWLLAAGYVGRELFFFTKLATVSIRTKAIVEDVAEHEVEDERGRVFAIAS